METVRAFFALELSEELKRRIFEVEGELERSGADIKTVKLVNLHVTMKFLGEIPVSRVEEIVKAVEEIDTHKFELEAKGIGSFPNMKMLRVVWVGIGRGYDNVISIFKNLDVALTHLGFQKEERFEPHITIGRVRSQRNKEALLRIIEKNSKRVFGTSPIESMVLKKSVLTESGPVYSDLKVFPLGD